MSEHDNDNFYWEPDPDFPLRQGDLLFNAPLALMPSQPEFVVRAAGAREAEVQAFDHCPENAPTTEIIAEARFGALSMVITPTCHVSEGEKDEDVVAVVPVEPLRLSLPTAAVGIRSGAAWRSARTTSSTCPRRASAGVCSRSMLSPSSTGRGRS